MNNRLKVYRICLFAFLLVSFSNFKCKKDVIDQFCKVERSLYSTIDNKQGMISYSNKYKRYAVSLPVTTPNNIDSELVGFVCDLPNDLKSVGLNVIASGTLKSFNSNENMTPELGGQELYFFETTKLIKQ